MLINEQAAYPDEIELGDTATPGGMI